jgi:hypothetical protein
MDQPARDSIRAAAWTALWTFVATFSLAALDWLQAVAEWASDAPDAAAFPSVAVLGKALVSATVAAVAFALNAAYRLAQARGVGLPGAVPSYTAQDDQTSAAVADVVVGGEDEFGLWLSGALRPGVTDEEVRTLRASTGPGSTVTPDRSTTPPLRAALFVLVIVLIVILIT